MSKLSSNLSTVMSNNNNKKCSRKKNNSVRSNSTTKGSRPPLLFSPPTTTFQLDLLSPAATHAPRVALPLPPMHYSWMQNASSAPGSANYIAHECTDNLLNCLHVTLPPSSQRAFHTSLQGG